MKQKSIDYFENIIMPMIRSKHPQALPHATIVVLGSVGLGNDDDLSDVEAVVYLPDDIWKQHGMLQIDLDKCVLDTNLWKQGGSIICVHPLSWLLDGKGEKILADGAVPWDELSNDSSSGLFVLHNQPVLHDPQDRIGRLRSLTAPDKMPDIIWRKALLSKLSDFVGDGIQEVKRCVSRGQCLDAYIPFGNSVQFLYEIGFVLSHRYYPYRKHLSWAFGKLPAPMTDLVASFEQLSAAADWRERINIMEGIFDAYRGIIISGALLPELDFSRVDTTEMPLHDNAFYIAKQLLENADWHEEQAALYERTRKLGLAPEAARWVGWWDMK